MTAKRSTTRRTAVGAFFLILSLVAIIPVTQASDRKEPDRNPDGPPKSEAKDSALSPAALAFCAFFADAPKDDTAKKELDKLQGKWTVISDHFAGQPDLDMKGVIVTITGNQWVEKGTNRTFTFKLDPSKSPPEINILADERRKGARDTAGIYQIDGDNLKVCTGLNIESPNKDGTFITTKVGKRPTAFDQRNKESHLVVLKRGEIAVKPKPDDERSKKLIVGRWKVSSSSPPFSGDAEFTEDGKIKNRAFNSNEWKQFATYKIEDGYLLFTMKRRDKDGKETEAAFKSVIRKLTETEFEIPDFKGKRVK